MLPLPTIAHLGHDRRDQPVVRHDVVVEDLAELLIRDPLLRAVIRVGGGVADQHVDVAERAPRLVDQVLQRLLAGNVGRDRDGGAVTETRVDLGRHRRARILLAAGDHHLRPLFGTGDRTGLADPARGAGDEDDLAGQIEDG